MMTATTKTFARCECGALEVHIEAEPVVQLVCHCSDCRVFSGMRYVEGAFFKSSACTVHGQAIASALKGGSGFAKVYYSCARCKTPLYVTVAALNGALAVLASRLSPFKFEALAHVWTSEKALDVVVPTGIAQSSGSPPKDIADFMVSNFWGRK